MWFLFSKVLANSLSYKKLTCVSRMFDSHGFIRCSPFWSLNPLEYLPKQFSSPVLFCFGWQHLPPPFLLASYLLVLGRQVGLIWFCIFKSSVPEILSFSFCLVNSDCDVHPQFTLKCFYYFFNLINLELGLKPSFSIHISVSFVLGST